MYVGLLNLLLLAPSCPVDPAAVLPALNTYPCSPNCHPCLQTMELDVGVVLVVHAAAFIHASIVIVPVIINSGFIGTVLSDDVPLKLSELLLGMH